MPDSITRAAPPANDDAESLRWLVASLFLVFGIGVARASLGGSMTVSALYVLPVVLCTWHSGRVAALGVAAVGCVVYLLAHAVLGERTLSSVLGNAGLNLSVCALAVVIVARFRSAYDERSRTVDALESALASLRVRSTVRYCAACRTLCGDSAAWEPVEDFVTRHMRAHVLATLCPDCAAVRR